MHVHDSLPMVPESPLRLTKQASGAHHDQFANPAHAQAPWPTLEFAGQAPDVHAYLQHWAHTLNPASFSVQLCSPKPAVIILNTGAMQGKPLAYTPFCDNNRAMDGFRFWKQGFWQDHLAGRPYHISALYVVDLARFRQAQEHRLRWIWHGVLSENLFNAKRCLRTK